MKKIILIIKDLVFWFAALYDILWLAAFHILFLLLWIEYGKKPDDNIAITKCHSCHWIKELIKLDSNGFISIINILFIIAIVLKLFKINLISKKQIIVFTIGLLLLILLMAIDPLGAFKFWYYD